MNTPHLLSFCFRPPRFNFEAVINEKNEEDREKLRRQQQLLEAYAVSTTIETYVEKTATTESTGENVDLMSSTTIVNNIIESTSTKKPDTKHKIINNINEDVEEFRDMTVAHNNSDYQYYDYDSNEMTEEDYL